MFVQVAAGVDPNTWILRELPDPDPDAVAEFEAEFGPHPGAPDGALAHELDIATRDLDELDAAQLLDAVIGFEKLAAWVAARQHALIAAFHARPGDGTVRPAAHVVEPAAQPAAQREWAADEIGLALTLGGGAAAIRVAHADRFDQVLRPTRDLLAAGRICPARARLIADMLTLHDDEVAAAVQDRVLPAAPGQTWAQLRAALTRALTAVLPDPEQRHRTARRGRRVELHPAADGMATLSAFLTATEAVASFEWITRLARGVVTEPGEHGSMDQRRADVLTALLTGRLVAAAADPGAATVAPADTGSSDTDSSDADGSDTDSSDTDSSDADSSDTDSSDTGFEGADHDEGRGLGGHTGGGHTGGGHGDPRGAPVVPSGGAGGGRQCMAAPVNAHRPLVHVTVSISTLMGLDDEPGELAGYGPIPAPVAREIAGDPDSTWRRLLTDPLSGQLLDYGRDTYRPPIPLARFVRARDGVCRHPGCRRPAIACDIDHTRSWHPDGVTAEDNLCCLCAHHHTLKHQPGWRVILHDDRRLEWITPTGHHYWSRAVDHRPTPPSTAPPEPDPPPRRTTRELFDAGPPAPDDDPAPF